MSSLDREMKKRKKKKKGSKVKEEYFDYTKLPPKEYRQIGVIKDDSSFSRKAGQRSELAYDMIPKIAFFIKLCFFIIIVCSTITVYTVYKKPSAMLLYSFQNGDVKCPLKNINIRTGQIIPRTAQEQKVCSLLDLNNNKGYISSGEAVPESGTPQKNGGN